MLETEHRPPRQPLVAPGAIEHHASDLTVTVSADVTLTSLQQQLAAHHQWLPIDGASTATLGHLVDTNSTGPLRLGYGAWRDLLLGAQFSLRDGRLITGGGRTMKNVAGYDVTKLMIGQRGTFGRLKTLTMRTYRRPDGALLAQFPVDYWIIPQLLPTPLRPQWAMVCEGSLWLGYLGDARAIDFYEQQLAPRKPSRLARQSVDDDIEFRGSRWLPRHRQSGFRVAVPPARIGRFIDSAHVTDFAADPVFGIVVGSCTAGEHAIVCRASEDVGGTAVFDSAASALEAYSDNELEVLNRLWKVFGA